MLQASASSGNWKEQSSRTELILQPCYSVGKREDEINKYLDVIFNLKATWSCNFEGQHFKTLYNSIIFTAFKNLKTLQVHVQYRCSLSWHQFVAEDVYFILLFCKKLKFISRYHWLCIQLVHVDDMIKYEKDVILTVFQAKTCFKKKYHACLPIYFHRMKSELTTL